MQTQQGFQRSGLQNRFGLDAIALGPELARSVLSAQLINGHTKSKRFRVG
ncbi:hypothetical protein [Leptolyngbya sp. FACHB-1624]